MSAAVGRGLRAIVLAAACAFQPLAAMAQTDFGELQLVVTDATGGALNASGRLASEAPQTLRAFETNAQGRFTLERVPFGLYRLTIEREGFAPYTSVVDVRSAVPRELRIQLTLGALVSQVNVNVASARPLVDPDRTGVSFTIAAGQLQSYLPAVPGRRVLDLVDQQPGWLMEANGVLHPRGSEYQTLFVVDGVPMDENRSPAFAPDLQESEILAMSVLTANFPAEYGRKLGGVVEVTTSRDVQEGFHGTLDLGAGSFGTGMGSFSATHGWSRRALTFSGSLARTDRYLDPPVRENFTNTGSLSGVLASYQDRPTDDDRLHLSWHRRQSEFLVPNEILQQEAGQRQENTGREHTGQAAWTRILGRRSVFNARGMVQHLSAALESNPQSTPVIVQQDRSFTRGYANASLSLDAGRHQIKFGGDLVFTPVKEQLAYVVTDESAADEETEADFAFADEQRNREQSLFVQDTLRAGRLTVSAGLRFDRYDFVVRDTALSPRLGIAWAATRDLVVRASYDRVFQTPAVENLLLASSPLVERVSPIAVRLPVEPSRGNFLEAGVTAAVAGRARLDVTAYRRTLTNFADDDVFLNTGVSFPVAFAAAEIRGLDTKLTLPVWRGVGGFVSYALLKGTADLPVVGGLFLGEEALEELEETGSVAITQDQRHTFRAQARYDVGSRMWAAATLRYGSGLPIELEDEIEPGELDELEDQYGEAILDRVDLAAGRVRSNLTLDAGVGIEIWRTDRRRLMLRAELANVADRVNVINFAGLFSGTALGPPRSATIRIRYEF
jgi:outer membrane receptor protein involved in Fe transport